MNTFAMIIGYGIMILSGLFTLALLVKMTCDYVYRHIGNAHTFITWVIERKRKKAK